MNLETKNYSGFTILEVVLTMSILMTLSIFATQMIKNGLDMRDALSAQARTTSRLSIAMNRIATDIEHALVMDRSDGVLNYSSRATKMLFRTKLENRSHELSLTTLTHRSLQANDHESDQTYVVYKLMPRKDQPDVTDLYRGESPIIPQSFREELKMKPFATNIKALNIYGWNGERWDKERWDTDASDYRDLLPQMVMIEVEAWDKDFNVGETPTETAPTVKLNTVVIVEKGFNNKEPRQRSQTIKWY